MKVALDTNILAYAEGVGDSIRHQSSLKLLEKLPEDRVVVPAQVLGELFRVLTGKRGIARQKARAAVLGWADAFSVCDSTHTALIAALDLATDHGMQIWDGSILAVAAEARCRVLLSEDLQHDYTWRGVTVVNPYLPNNHPLLEGLLLDS